MTETTQKERDLLRLGTIINGAQYRALNDAERCARIERCCLLRSEIEALGHEVPEDAIAWDRYRLSSASEGNRVMRTRWVTRWGRLVPAPDLRPDESGPITLPILDC